MALTRQLGRRLLRLRYVREAMDVEPDYSALRSRRLAISVGLMFLQLFLGWPAIALIGSAGAAVGEPALGALGASVSYAMSWVVLGAAILVGGRESFALSRAINQHLTALAVRRMVGEPVEPSSSPS